MKTKVLIKATALTLFNQRGVMNVTLRDVAAELQKSYGNITYHYAGKEVLLQELYNDLQLALQQLGQTFGDGTDLLRDFILAPRATYELSLQYRFFYSDYVELQRHYPELMQEAQKQQQLSMQFYREKLLHLQKLGLLRSDLPAGSLDNLMLLSGLVRTFFFIQSPPAVTDAPAEAARYFAQLNLLLWPYLTPAGTTAFQKYTQLAIP
jgi:AcrR family transcriptional regulator